ncbi:LysE family translocator [Thalassolituus sp. LLYu03]|uniref:LysE family translocator n=1 Tax=Thalassolituus sp. LLYu03 TaxID=3421656 RepID=UPI003D2B2FEF
MDITLYLIFLTTTAMLILVPGPSAILAAGQGAGHHVWKAQWTVLGIACADLLFFLLSATGVASLVLASPLLFNLIRWGGVLYLLWLAYQALFSHAGMIRFSPADTSEHAFRLFIKGLMLHASNPKALVYFAALLPQFLNPEIPLLPQLLIMGATLLITDLLVFFAYTLMGSWLARRGLSEGLVRAINRLAGATLLLVAGGLMLMDI